jgi:hypothetical protein
MSLTRTAAALLVATTIVLGACSDSSDTSSDTTTSEVDETTTTGSEDTTTSAPEDTTSTTDALAGLEATATAALLTASDLGPTFVDDTYTPSQGPPPCGGEDVDVTIPPAVRVGSVAVDNDAQLFFQEAIRVYQDDSEGSDAYTQGVAGLACTNGTVDNSDGSTTAVQISEPTDVSADLGVDEAFQWQVATDSVQGVIIAARLSAAVVTFEFQTVLGNDTSSAPDPLAVAQAGIEKITSSG